MDLTTFASVDETPAYADREPPELQICRMHVMKQAVEEHL